jgi:glutaredoxin
MKKITIYGLSTCPWCRKTKALFTRRGVPFEYTDYDLAEERTQRAIIEELDRAGVSGFPFVRIGAEVISGYQPERFNQLLDG